jgi:glycine cleavage system T protein
MCVAFEIARTEAFLDLQRRIVANAQALARGLTDRGLKLAYGGTDTHLLLLDLNRVPGRGQASGLPLYGEVAARILDLAGIVVNKQTIPGDSVTALATGIRLGTPWVTQRGMGPEQMDRLAECIARIVCGISPFYYEGVTSRLPRGKVDIEVLEEVRWAVDEMACVAQAEIECACSDYPHYCLRPRQVEPPTYLFAPEAAAGDHERGERAALIDESDRGILRVTGWRARAFLDDLCTADIAGLEAGQGACSFVLDQGGMIIDDVAVWRMARDERGRDRYHVVTNPENTDRVVSWMRGLSDGYVLFDEEDVWRKVRGPVSVEVISDAESTDRVVTFAVQGSQAGAKLRQVLGTAYPRALDDPEAYRRAELRYADQTLYLARSEHVADRVQFEVTGSAAGLHRLWAALVEAGATPVEVHSARQAFRQSVGLPPSESYAGEGRSAVPYSEALPHMFDLAKPHYVGQSAMPRPDGAVASSPFAWMEPADPSPKRTALYEEHRRLGAKFVPFAGWEMPVWYTSVGDEHRAVREAAGLFDVAHMGTLEICGPHAVDFLDLVSANYAHWLKDGDSQYAGLLDPDGRILDDVFVYRRAWDRFLLVSNAANADKVWAWLNAVNDRQVTIDRERPWVRVLHPATLRNLKDPRSGPDQRVDVALQGPASLDILLACADDAETQARLRRLPRTRLIEAALGDVELLISRTGYTGEDVGFELYVHPDRAVALWRMLLERGAARGIKPCGLAARDSTRIEAGLPLYGHELAGSLNITQNEAGFGGYVKYHKPFYIGRVPYKAYNDGSTRRIVRFQLSEHGARALRGGEESEPVVNRRGKVIGAVTSCALVGDRQIGMALVDERYAEPGTELLIYPGGGRAVSKPPIEFEIGDTVALPIRAAVLPRFPEK